MDKKTYLCRYHNLLERIERKKEYIDFCQKRADSIPGPKYGERVNNPSPSLEAPYVKWVYRGIEAEEELKQLEAKAEGTKHEIETAISELEDEEMQMVLVYRYIDWMSWEEISGKIYCSLATVYRKHREALEKLIVPDSR